MKRERTFDNMIQERYRKRLNEKINEFSGKFMSNTKWKKLFKALSEQNQIIGNCFIKAVLLEELITLPIPALDDFERAFSDTGIKDVLIGGPISFNEIEWIEFPKRWTCERKMRLETLNPFGYEQDILKIKEVIEKIGQFEMEFDCENLTVYGYR